MKQIFDFLENTDLSATVCDKDGIVVYQNKVAIKNDGNAIGKNLFNCHSAKTNEKIKAILETGTKNVYEIMQKGKRSLVYHTPWFEKDGGEISGIIELVMELPEQYPIINRDKQ